jgi:hypothetical protein
VVGFLKKIFCVEQRFHFFIISFSRFRGGLAGIGETDWNREFFGRMGMERFEVMCVTLVV